MADENRIATHEWLYQNLLPYKKVANPPNDRQGCSKSRLISNYNVDETLLTTYDNNRLVPRGKCVGLGIKYYPIAIEGANDTDRQMNTGKLIVGGSIEMLSVNKDRYGNMLYYKRDMYTGETISISSYRSKIIRLNADLSIDESFNIPNINGDIVSVDCFNNGNIAVRTRNGWNANTNTYNNHLIYILDENGSIITWKYCWLSVMCNDRDKLLILEGNTESEIELVKHLYITDSNLNKISNNILSSRIQGYVNKMSFGGVSIQLQTIDQVNYFNYYNAKDLNNVVLWSTPDIRLKKHNNDTFNPSTSNINWYVNYNGRYNNDSIILHETTDSKIYMQAYSNYITEPNDGQPQYFQVWESRSTSNELKTELKLIVKKTMNSTARYYLSNNVISTPQSTIINIKVDDQDKVENLVNVNGTTDDLVILSSSNTLRISNMNMVGFGMVNYRGEMILNYK